MRIAAKLALVLGFVLAVLFSPRPAAAQRSQSVTCESNNGKRNYCGSYTRDQVTFQRQISGSSCVERQSWAWIARVCGWTTAVARSFLSASWWLPLLPAQDGFIPVQEIPGRPRVVGMAAGGIAAAPASTKATASAAIISACVAEKAATHSPTTAGKFRRYASSAARVVVFDDRNFRGANDSTKREVPDLRVWKVTSKYPHTWNNRISSLQVL